MLDRYKRWEHRVAPVDPDNEFHALLAERFNVKPKRFYTRFGARDAVKFYEHRLHLPIRVYVRDRRDDRGGT